MKRIAVLTSGGDAPGMNAAIRAVVRAGAAEGMKVFGVRQGFTGLLTGDIVPLAVRDVSGIIQRGGTMLGSARCAEFKTDAGVDKALHTLGRLDLEALVVIGGNGSQSGARDLGAKGFPVVGVASTIDNDLAGSDVTLGVDTALNIALESIDRLKTTADSHRRGFLVEVMGRKCGYLALMAGIAGGAEAVVIPEAETSPDAIARELRDGTERGKPYSLVVVAEGAQNNAQRLLRYFEEHPDRLDLDLRVTILGHVQRGGSPTAFDRLLATRLGAAAVRALAEGRHGVLIGLQKGAVTATPYAEVVGVPKPLDPDMLALAHVMSR
jgi:6-phosphofructokinase 1